MLNALCAQYNLAESLNKNIKKKKKKKKQPLSKSDVLGLDVAQGRTLQQIYCGGQLQHNAPVYSSEVCQQWQNLCSTMMLGTSILINKCWENLIKIGFDHGII